MSKIAIASTALAALILAACGGSAPPPVAGPAVERGIFISSGDCTDSKKLTAEQCEKAIDAAVAQYDELAVAYKTVHLCEAAAGTERCVKSVDGKYRARLQAFFVVMSATPTAVPLYPPQVSNAAFQSMSKQIISAKDETIFVTAAAATLANENAKLPGPVTDTVSAAAADIH